MILEEPQNVILVSNLENHVHHVIYKMDVHNVEKDIGHSLEYVLKVYSDICKNLNFVTKTIQFSIIVNFYRICKY